MIVVTGGAGFIGSFMVWQLNQSKLDDILVVDDLGCESKWQNLAKRQIDHIIEPSVLFNWLSENRMRVSAIIHMGACSSTDEQDADFLMRNNVHYSMKLFQFCTELRLPFLYASSAATYGVGDDGFRDDHQVVAKLRPTNKYGYSKQLFDAWVLRQKSCPPFWAGLKFFNVYGPNEYHKGKQASVVYHAYQQIRERGRLRLFRSARADVADGEQKRDFVYVKDVTRVMEYLLQNQSKAPSGIYNLGTGQSRTFLDLGRGVFQAMGAGEPKIDWVETPEVLRTHYQYFTEAEMSKLRHAGYAQPFFSLEQGILDYVQNHLMSPDPYA